MRPDFLFIGPDKTGSTWIYELLRAHSEVFVPEVKDLYFFDRHYDRGLEWYLSFFADAPAGARAAGELSHDYLFSPEAAERIARDLPGVRLLTCLREPVERTFSHYLYMVRSGRTREPFERALEAYPELIDNSRYASHLEPWLARFDRGQIRILWFERLKADPREFAGEIFDFLGVSPLEGFPYERRVLAAARPRVHGLARLAKRGADLFRELGLARLVGAVKRSPTVRRLLYRTYRREEKPRLHPATRARLAERFRPEVERLEELLGVALEGWPSGSRGRWTPRREARQMTTGGGDGGTDDEREGSAP